MKKAILLVAVILSSLTTFSQNSEKKEKIKSLKVAYITEQLALTESEAQKFWPVYNAYETEKDAQRKTSYQKYKQISDDISETKAQSLLKELLELEKERQNLRSNYIKNLMKVLPAKKIIQLKTAEDAFNRKMLQEYKKRHGDRKEKR